MSDDLLHDIDDEMFKFVLDFVDGLPKEYNTVDVAQSRIGELGKIEVVGNVVAIPEPVPVQIRNSDREAGIDHLLEDKTYIFFHMSGDSSFKLMCCVHNVENLNTFPYGKDVDSFAQIITRLQGAFKNGRKVQVVGRYVTMTSDRKRQRVLYVDTLNIEDDALTSKMTGTQFDRFLDICSRNGVGPLALFMEEVFTTFDADEYLMKMVALFCLSPKSREEMIHIMLLSAPGEGKDYLIDKIIQPMSRCGKVGADATTTAAAIVGAMSSSDLTSLGVGVMQKYHNERLAVSEVQTWGAAKWGSLLGVLADGYLMISKGQLQDMKRYATENVLLAGNIPNNWKEGMKHWDKLSSVFGGKNQQYSKQAISRMSLIFARISLLKNPNPLKKAQLMARNMDRNSSIKDNELFDSDETIKIYCSRTDLTNREKSRLIRERIIELLHMVGKGDKDISEMMRQSVFQTFFGQYFKHVSLMNPSVERVWDKIYRRLDSMAKHEAFGVLLCNEAGDLDARKFTEFMNLCKAFAKINGHSEIEHDDMVEAEFLMKESISTLAEDFGLDLLTSGMDMIELEILKFISENGNRATRDEIRKHLRVTGADQFFDKNMDNLGPYLEEIQNNFVIRHEAIPEGIRTELNIEQVNSITDRDRGGRQMSDDDLDGKLDGVFDEQ